LNPGISVIARAARGEDVLALRKMGAGTVIQPEFEGGIEMVRQALDRYTSDDERAARLIADLRADFYRGER
jgi:CPA2 family monovalent cation:H+ antiporter-2